MIHEGFYKVRLEQNNPREVAFSEAWKAENCAEYRMAERLIPNCTERDAIVAATIIQWLGSNLGMSFLCEVFRESPETRRWFGLSQTATETSPKSNNLPEGINGPQ